MAKRDWTSVPPLLLCAVAERLIPNAYARLCAVCTAWASALTPEEWEKGQRQSYYLPRSLNCPWLMVPSGVQDVANGLLTFLSLPESLRPYRIAAPDLFPDLFSNDRAVVFGSHAGWLAVVDEECNMCLINPLTHARVPLPSFTTLTIPRVEVVRDPASGFPTQFIVYDLLANGDLDANGVPFPLDKFQRLYFRKIILSSSPSSSPDDYIVAFIYHYDQYLAFARAGDTAWTALDGVPPMTYGYTDALFVDRKLYAVADHGQIDAFDFTQTEPQPELFAKRIGDRYQVPKYLVFSSGYLMQMQRIFIKDYRPGFRTSGFSIQRLDLAQEGEKHWIPVEDIGCQSIFIGMSQSLVISTQKMPGVRQNCIYFTDDYVDWFLTDGRDSTRDMGVFDIIEGTCEFLYPPEAWLTWPPPIWFVPVLN